MFIIDFDHTLYDTNLLSEELWRVLRNQGVAKPDFERTYKLAIYGAKSEYIDYTFEKHLSILTESGYKLDRAEVLEALYSLLTVNRLFADSVSFLKYVSGFGNTILLTAGNADFQKKKIVAAKIKDYFDKIIFVHRKKENTVQKLRQEAKIIYFINDCLEENMAVKKSVPDAVVITKVNPCRNNTRQLEKSGLPFFNNLEEITKYVRGQIK